ncbi:serine/threonine-protein kinase [Streptomyces nitrosporeus]|uniref:serine/threonine-protein kinase n=1 Tax=Streptomyces nitrosporeus TaxID=28894 RepID=UPI00167ECDFA|nr:serine/threonine-protein kinase [Streptomyces nitrosporeus]GGY78618.1 hypothetical protein GCM10010327_06130 [Streptomyces nitrosporeus]
MSTGAGPSGRVVDGRFTLVARLGGGGMGMVWRARDQALHRDVALKEVRPPDPALAEHDPGAARTLRARVMREARALARLDHPNVVTIHHIVDPGEEGYPWIVMELVEGSSLQDRLAAGPMPPREAAELGRGVLSALRAAHAAGIHHRDVKPANVLLRTDGRPVLTDFGIAAIRESTSLTATGALIGSPDYIAPERIRGTEGDPSSDLWSLGMMLYVAVEGHHPLRRATTLATLAAVLDEEVPPPVRAGALGPVLGALLTRDTAARPDAGTLDRMLAEAAAGGTVTPAVPPAPATPPASVAPAVPAGTLPLSRPAVPPVHAPHPVTAADPGTGPGRRHDPWSSPGAGAATVPDGGPDRDARLRRTIRRIALASSLTTTLAAVAVYLWAFGPLSGDEEGGKRSGTAVSGAPSPVVSEDPAPAASGTAPAPATLLTPGGARQAIEALAEVMGGTEVTDFTLYDGHASASAPLESDPGLYDDYSYSDGRAERSGAGGPLTSDSALLDLEEIDWDRLPALLRDARTTLNVPDPALEDCYVIVEPASVFHEDRPVLRVYVSDDYGGAHLTAGIDGKVIDRNPREGG